LMATMVPCAQAGEGEEAVMEAEAKTGWLVGAQPKGGPAGKPGMVGGRQAGRHGGCEGRQRWGQRYPG
jgi:hypothetical protein